MSELMFQSSVGNLQSVLDKKFIIPSYQRPYVWRDEQINKILSDFFDAYSRDDSHYYIGTVITASELENEEIIDGQQRFTTLWLMAVSFKLLDTGSSIVSFLRRGNDLRFDFAIRKQLKSYLTSLCERTKFDASQYSDSDVENNEYLINVARALVTIVNKLGTLSFPNGKSLKGFGDYIFENVHFIANRAPRGLNLNKLFSTINNSGLQLEQSDILKSRLLFALYKKSESQDELLTYGKIWEACENMSTYFEKNVRSVFPETQWLNLDRNDFMTYNGATFKFRNSSDQQIVNDGLGILLSEMIDGNIEEISPFVQPRLRPRPVVNDDSEVVYCRSIINFPQLLLHAYRVFLYQQGKPDFVHPFHIKYLTEIFGELVQGNGELIKEFFYCLWKVRAAFDRYVIKWVKNSEDRDEELNVSPLYKSDQNGTRYFQRSHPETKSSGTMLQSVLYFTGNYNTQIWLTPYLKRLIDGENANKCLEEIDNELSISQEEDKVASWRLMDASYMVNEGLDIAAYLDQPNGTNFRHYWFQKLEYILWKGWPHKDDPKFSGYKITSKNSVEHVFPQNHEWGKRFSDKALNSFGNLALLNVSQNSSYSNQDPEKKRVDFMHKDPYDSLKLYYVYSPKFMKEWNETELMAHQNKMIDLILQHYNRTQ